MQIRFEGVGVAIVTPFNEDKSIDFSSFEKVINHCINGRVDYIVALGTTGESATLSGEEKKSVIAFCKEKINNRVPLVVGAGGNNTADVVNTIKTMDKKGVSGILSVAPYYNKPSQKGIYEHFKAIASSCDLPLILYNVPGRTSSNIKADTAVQLAKDFNNIVAIKEASGNMGQVMQLIKNKPDDFDVLSGDDALTLPMISLGGKGAISVIANSHPLEFTSLVKAALEGDYDTAKQYQYKILDIITALFKEGNPSGIKAVLEVMGLCKQTVRLPLVNVSEEHYTKIQEVLNSL